MVRKTAETLAALRALDPHFVRWYQPGRSRTEALERPVIPEPGHLQVLYTDSLRKRDFDSEGNPAINFSLSLWSGHGGDEAASIRFGVGGALSHLGIFNSVVVELPAEGAGRTRLLRLPVLRELLRICVRLWNPDRALLNSSYLQSQYPEPNEAGWLTYRREPLASPVDGIVQERFEVGHFFRPELPAEQVDDHQLAASIQRLERSLTGQQATPNE